MELDAFVLHDLNDGLPPLNLGDYDYVLLLDVIEHLSSPEHFVERLREALKLAPATKLLVSTANIGFFINRLMLLIGQFNYGKRGILDLTHARLFTFESFRRLFEQGGFRVVETRGIPGPFPLALRNATATRLAMAVNAGLIQGCSRSLLVPDVLRRGTLSRQYLLREAPSSRRFEARRTKNRPRCAFIQRATNNVLSRCDSPHDI